MFSLLRLEILYTVRK